MIPICRDSGSVVAFGGRAMEADQQPKYLNSPETPIYSKGRTLYGLHLTKGGHPARRLRGAGGGVLRFRAGAAGRRARGRGHVRDGAHRAAGAPASSVRRQNCAQLRPRRRRPGGRGAVVAAARAGGLPRERRPAAAGRRPRRVHPEAGRGRLHGPDQGVAPVSGVPDRPGGAGPGFRRRRGAAGVPEPDAADRRADPGRRRAATSSPTGLRTRPGSPRTSSARRSGRPPSIAGRR